MSDILLRALGDQSIAIGDGTDAKTSPIEIFGQEYLSRPFDAITAPPGSTSAILIVDRSTILLHNDGHLVSVQWEFSLDGGRIWGGSFIDASDGQVPMCYSLASSITTGGGPWDEKGNPAVLPSGMSAYGIIGVALPPDQGMGVMVRPIIASKEIVDVGISCKFGFDPRSQRQLSKDIHHSVAFDAVGAGASYNGASSLSWTHANVGTSNLYVRVNMNCTGITVPTVSALTYDSVSMLNSVTNATSSSFQGTLFGRAEIFEKVNPNTGSKTVALTWATASNQFGGGTGSVTYTGVNQSAPSGTPPTATNGTSNTPSITMASTTSGNYVSDCISIEEKVDAWVSGDATASNTKRLFGNNPSLAPDEGQCGGAQDAASTGAAMTLSWTLGNSVSRRWISCACEILAAASGTVGNPYFYRNVAGHGGAQSGGM